MLTGNVEGSMDHVNCLRLTVVGLLYYMHHAALCIASFFPLTILRTRTKMTAARECPAFTSLADRRMRRAVSAVSDGQQGRPQVLCGVWADACPHMSPVCL